MIDELKNQLPRLVKEERDHGARWNAVIKCALVWQIGPSLVSFYIAGQWLFWYDVPFGTSGIFLVIYVVALFVIPPAAATVHRSWRVGVISVCLPILAIGIPYAVWLLFMLYGEVTRN